MFSHIASSPVRAVVVSLLLVGGWPAQAQKVTVKAKPGQVKTKAADAAGTAISKTNTTSADPVVASAPQYAPRPAPAPALAAPAEARTESPFAWVADLGAAQAQAKATNRPIVAVFSGSDWCKPCIMYEQEVFAKPEFMEFAKGKLVLAHFDFPRQKKNQPTAAQLKLNEAAAAQLNREGDFPLAVIIAPDGKVLAKTGYIAGGPAAFEAYLKKVLPTL